MGEVKTILEPAKETPVRLEVDVLVVGGGPAGIIAAQAAAADGLQVALIDNRSFVGGNMTIGLPILGFLGQKGNQIIKGLPQKFIDRLKAVDAASEHRPCPLHMSLTLVEPEAVKKCGPSSTRGSGGKGVAICLFRRRRYGRGYLERCYHREQIGT